MSSTVVYGCDWCREIVPKDASDKPKYAAKVTVETLRSAIRPEPIVEEICADCRKALEALREGRYRRG